MWTSLGEFVSLRHVLHFYVTDSALQMSGLSPSYVQARSLHVNVLPNLYG